MSEWGNKRSSINGYGSEEKDQKNEWSNEYTIVNTLLVCAWIMQEIGCSGGSERRWPTPNSWKRNKGEDTKYDTYKIQYSVILNKI